MRGDTKAAAELFEEMLESSLARADWHKLGIISAVLATAVATTTS